MPDMLIGPRLKLRAPRPCDADVIVELLTDPDVRRYVGGPQDAEVVRGRLRLSTEHWGSFVIADHDDEAIGTLSFEQKRGPWELSFQLRHELWGQGLMTEAASLALAWFFASQSCDRCIAVTQVANLRTRSLLERLGATVTDRFEYKGFDQFEYEFRKGDVR